MKHIESINEWFKRKDDKLDNFIKDLIKIIKEENLFIGFQGYINKEYFYQPYSGTFSIIFEDKKYTFTVNYKNKCELSIYGYPPANVQIRGNWYLENNVSIPLKYYNAIGKIYKDRKKEEEKKQQKNAINKLPDISDVGRAAKKYNL